MYKNVLEKKRRLWRQGEKGRRIGDGKMLGEKTKKNKFFQNET